MFLLQDRPKAKQYGGQDGLKFIQHKLDGYRTTVLRFDNRVSVHGRKPDNLFDKMPEHLKVKFEALPPGTVLDGELHKPGVHATSVPTLINTGDPELQFSPFAAPILGGDPADHWPLWDVIRVIEDHFGFEAPHTDECGDWLDDIAVAALCDEAKARGIEGFIVKRAHYSGWFKIKPKKTVDCIVTAVHMGSGRLVGTLGSLTVAVLTADGKRRSLGNVGTGFDDDTRDELWGVRNALIGEVVEIEYDSLAAQGKLKFPRFVRLRPDKPAAECTEDQLQ